MNPFEFDDIPDVGKPSNRRQVKSLQTWFVLAAAFSVPAAVGIALVVPRSDSPPAPPDSQSTPKLVSSPSRAASARTTTGEFDATPSHEQRDFQPPDSPSAAIPPDGPRPWFETA